MEVARRLTELSDSIDEVERLIRTLPDLDPTPFLSGFAAIRDAINPSISAQVDATSPSVASLQKS